MNRTSKMNHDTLTMTERCLKLSARNIDTFLTCLILPVLMMILFVYVLGGAMNVGNASYVNYIVPGIILQCIGQCASTTAITVNHDLRSGIIDRFCTLPIRHTSVLSGHVCSAVLRNLLTTGIVILAALAVGFRPSAQIWDWLIVFVIVLLYILAISWISVYLGLRASSAEGAGAYAVFAVVLPYLSSGFAPTETMPKLMRMFAEHQPMTPMIESMRALLLGETVDTATLFLAFAWCLGLSLFFYVLSRRTFRNRIK